MRMISEDPGEGDMIPADRYSLAIYIVILPSHTHPDSSYDLASFGCQCEARFNVKLEPVKQL